MVFDILAGFAMFVKVPSIALRMVKLTGVMVIVSARWLEGLPYFKMTNNEAIDSPAQVEAIASGYIDLFVTCFCLELISFRYNQRLSHGFIAIS